MVAVVAPKDMSNDAAAVASYVKDPWNVIGMLRVRVAQCVAALCRHRSRCRRANPSLKSGRSRSVPSPRPPDEMMSRESA